MLLASAVCLLLEMSGKCGPPTSATLRDTCGTLRKQDGALCFLKDQQLKYQGTFAELSLSLRTRAASSLQGAGGVAIQCRDNSGCLWLLTALPVICVMQGNTACGQVSHLRRFAV